MAVYFKKPWVALRSLGLIAAGLLIAGTVHADIVWNFTDGTLTASSVSANLTVSALVAHNVGNGSASINATSANGGGTNNLAMSATAGALNLATSSYYEFTITAADGFLAKVQALTLQTRSTASGPSSIGFYFVSDNTYNNPYNQSVSTTGSWQQQVFNGNVMITSAVGSSITFRIYGSGGTSAPSQANWRLDDISLDAVALTPAEFALQYPYLAVPEPADYAAAFGAVSLLAVATIRFKRRRQVA